MTVAVMIAISKGGLTLRFNSLLDVCMSLKRTVPTGVFKDQVASVEE